MIQAAKYLGVPPWDLSKQSVLWRDWALICMTAEQEAQEVRQEQTRLRANQKNFVA